MGEVYLAEDTKLRRKVALKFLPAESMGDERAKTRLLREARAAATLDHPNICGIYEVGEQNGLNFIALQFVQGETLAARLKQGSPSVDTSVAIALQVAEAFAEAHKRGIVHRDIKPENIMLTERNHVKVLDFGLAKMLPEHKLDASDMETASQLSVAGIVMGTVPYMSPEQVRGEELDARSDIFSFGILLYELLCGRRPFDAKSKAEIISAILTQEPKPFIDSVAKRYPKIEWLIRKCMEKEPGQRYQTMTDLIIDLEQIRRDATTARISPPVKTFPPSKWKQQLVITAVVIVLGSIIYLAITREPPAPVVTKPIKEQAYDYYLRGKVKVSSENREDNESAIQLLEKAVAADPRLASAYAELARGYTIKAFYFAPNDQKRRLKEDADVAVEKALALNPNLAEAHFARGLNLWTHSNRFPHEQAIQSYRRAIELNPNFDEAHHTLGVIYFHIGLLDKGKDEIKKALAINPANTLARFRLGTIALYGGNYEEALRVLKSVPSEANPSIRDRAMATTLFHLGRFDEASTLTEESLKTIPTDEGGAMTSVKAMLRAREGKQAEAEAAIRHAIEIGKDFGHFHHTTYNIASAYALMNKPNEAMKWLQYTADDGFPCYPLFENDPNLNSLRKNEHFITFMRKFKQHWEHYKATL
jgi:tetratricopeptide (TPR) repeat protein/predicted Ser/Thr protein kinase